LAHHDGARLLRSRQLSEAAQLVEGEHVAAEYAKVYVVAAAKAPGMAADPCAGVNEEVSQVAAGEPNCRVNTHQMPLETAFLQHQVGLGGLTAYASLIDPPPGGSSLSIARSFLHLRTFSGNRRVCARSAAAGFEAVTKLFE
jgi:hypothetical protein